MSKKGKFARGGASGKPNSKLIIALSCIAAVLVILVIVLILLIPREQPPAETTAPTEITTAPTSEPTEEPTTVPPTTIPDDRVMLEWMVKNYEKNPDLAGWIKIEGTKLDNPVMYVKDNNNKYLYKNFQGTFSAAGLPYIKGACRLDPESDNLIIYGHNMNDGSMFGDLELYADEEYWKEHPIIQFSTLYEERQYEIVAAFFDRLYDDSEDCFKFYEFIHALNEDDFNEAYTYYKEHAEYETGVEAKYGDNLITLVTCCYHTEDGRFVVVARQIVDEPETESEADE